MTMSQPILKFNVNLMIFYYELLLMRVYKLCNFNDKILQQNFLLYDHFFFNINFHSVKSGLPSPGNQHAMSIGSSLSTYKLHIFYYIINI